MHVLWSILYAIPAVEAAYRPHKKGCTARQTSQTSILNAYARVVVNLKHSARSRGSVQTTQKRMHSTPDKPDQHRERIRTCCSQSQTRRLQQRQRTDHTKKDAQHAKTSQTSNLNAYACVVVNLKHSARSRGSVQTTQKRMHSTPRQARPAFQTLTHVL